MESPQSKIEEQKLFSFNGIMPQVHPSVYLAPGVKIIGDVVIEEGSSVWFNAVIRGDVNKVRIGKNSNIQDGSVLHVTGGTGPLHIGDGVTIGHKVCLHGCTIEDESLVGIGSVVLDNAVVQKHSMVAAGAIVTPGTVVPTGKLVAGIPAKPIRALTEAEIAYFPVSAAHYHDYAEKMKEGIA